MNMITTHEWNGTKVRKDQPQLLANCLALGLVTLLPAFAGLPEPGVRLYGTVALDGVIVTAADPAVVIEARKTPTGPAVASYQMGSQTNAGNFYSLKLNAESSAPLADSGNALFGSTLYLVVRDASGEREQKEFTLGGRGLSARVDFGSLDTDGDGMSDEFELANFGHPTNGDPNADLDLDGRPNIREFLQGTDPNEADGRHPADLTPADDRLTLQEVTDYILAWKTGGTWPIEPALNAPNIEDYITRAGALWKGGEVYIFDNDPTTNAPMWWVNPVAAPSPSRGGPRLASLPEAPETQFHVTRTLPASYRPNQPVPVTVEAVPAEETKAYVVVETPPADWNVRNLSHEGRWDAANRKIKWGPFFDQTPRTFTYEAVPAPTSGGLAEFAGRGSFDGYGLTATGPQRVWPPGQTPLPQLAVTAAEPAEVFVELNGEPGRSYQLEFSDDLGGWNAGSTITLDGQGRASVSAGEGADARFFRLRSLE
jgi:hypothetical protein